MGCGASAEAPPKKGFVFRVRLLGGLNLYNNSFGVQLPGTKTSTFNFSGKSDPYVVLECHGVKKKSRTVLHSQNPIWNEDFYFNVDTTMPIMKLTVYDADLVSKDDIIGRAEVNLHGLVERGRENEMWLPLKGAKANGEIGLSVIECYRSHVTLKDARDVKAADALTGSSDVFATVRVGQQEQQKTTIKRWTLNPVWNQSFTVYVPYGIESQLEIVLWDHDTIGHDNNIGWFYKALDGKPSEGGPREFQADIVNASGVLSYTLQDDTEIEVPPPGPVTEEMRKQFPPTAPQTANFLCRVVGAYNLAGSDRNYVKDLFDAAEAKIFHKYNEPKATSDPFVRLTCEGQVYDTTHVNNSLEPHWNESFRFVARDKMSSELTLEVWDHDLISNDALGKVVLPLSSMKPGENTEMWSFLDNGRGEIGIELKMNFQLKVRVVSCSDLPAKDLNGMCDPYVKLTVAGETYQTRVCRDNRAPYIDENFRWSISTLQKQVLRLEVYDSDLMLFKKSMSEEFLGSADIPLAELAAGIPVTIDAPLKFGNGKAQGSVKLVLTNEIPLPPSALSQIAQKGEEALKAAVAKANAAKDFVKQLREPDPEKGVEGEYEVLDQKIDLRPRFTRIAVEVVGLRGLTNCSSPLYVGVSVPLQGQRFKSKEVNDSKNPDIGERFDFNVPTKTISGVEISVFESAKHPYTSWSDTYTARGFVSFTDFNNKQGLIRGAKPDDMWIPLSNGGEACIRVAEMFRYNVRVIGAKGLNTKADPYVIVRFDKSDRHYRTSTVSKDPKKDRTEGVPGEPFWDEQFNFFSTEKGIMSFKIMDAEVLTEDKALDQATFDTVTLRRGVPVTTTLKMPKGGELTVYIKEEEKMGLVDQLVDAAGNAAKLASKAVSEGVDAAASKITGALGGLFGK